MDPDLAAITAAPTPADPEGRLPFLLADFLACALEPSGAPGSFGEDGVAGTVSVLALRASAHDRDDIDWQSLHHPGAVVWPVVVALAAAHDVSGDVAAQAAARGYLTAATVADLLGPGHRSAWHVTATAGALGAAAAAAVLLGADRAGHERALALATANTGGLARAARERRGAAAFNRAAAATLGLAAARAAVVGVPSVEAPMSGADGMRAVMGGGAAPGSVVVRDGLTEAAPRMLPVSGFLQGAVDGAARARGLVRGDLVELRIGLAAGTLPLVDNDLAGPWWDARTSSLRAWAAGSPYAAARPGPLDDRPALVTLEAADLPVGHARIRATTDSDVIELVASPVTLADADGPTTVAEKWRDMLGPAGGDLLDLARTSLAATGRPGRLAATVAR